MNFLNKKGYKIVVDKKISDRKIEHLKIPIESDVQHKHNYFREIKLIHNALPEYDLNEIDLSVDFFGKTISAPICIAGMTGGHPIAKEINKILAYAAEKENIVLGVGSQRAGIEEKYLDSYKIIRSEAPNIPIIGNIGIGQISDSKFKNEIFKECIHMIDADVMAIHFNALHELLQDEGNTNFKLFKKHFQYLRNEFKLPIIAKETGNGFNKEIINKLEILGFDGFDVGGLGGTSFAAIESKRDNNKNKEYSRNPATLFRDWGIPTPVSILNIREISKKMIIATGGLRTGIDIVKSIALGANLGGIAYNFLISAWSDYKQKTNINTIKEIKTLKNEIRAALWLVNIKNINDLINKKSKIIFLGDLYQWINQEGG
ncbi:MAG: type 2 isopentenyl-diphosphate Delta-isomerase [Promethearchaeota archaeon]|nr:MAG: type 2 isopentenyl-diphosphate Delta-isomerase [Candidatus Lokiarchaeota archaeon]